MPRTAWVFEDIVNSEIYELEINPSQADLPEVTSNYSPMPTAAGRQILFEGRVQPVTLNFSGTLLTEEQYRAMNSWNRKRKQIKITDDQGYEYWVYLTGFNPQRVRDTQHPWRHTFSASCIVVDWQ